MQLSWRSVVLYLLITTALVVVCGLAVLFPGPALAQDLGRIVPCDGADCGLCDLGALAQNVVNFMVYLTTVVAAVMFSYAGFLYLTSGAGSENQVKTARWIFKNVAVGMIIVISAWLLIDTMMKVLLRTDSNLGPWNNVCQTGSTGELNFPTQP